MKSIAYEAFVESSEKLRDSILAENYGKAEDWLIAYQRHLTSLSQNVPRESLKEILREQKKLFSDAIETLNSQRNAQAIERIKALVFYNKIRNQAF